MDLKMCYNLFKEDRHMISCPYCGKEIPEDTTYCEHCRSMLITRDEAEEQGGEKGFVSRVFNPWSAVALMVVLSGIIFFVFRSASTISAEASSSEDAALAKGGPELPSEGEAVPAAGTRKPSEGSQEEDSAFYNQVVEYEERINNLFEQAEKLVLDADSLQKIQPGEDAVNSEKKKFGQIRPLLMELRKIEPPAGLERCQSALVNGMSMIQNALRSQLMYVQSWDKKHLESVQNLMESSGKQRAYAMDIIGMVKAENAPPPPPAEEEKEPVEEEGEKTKGGEPSPASGEDKKEPGKEEEPQKTSEVEAQDEEEAVEERYEEQDEGEYYEEEEPEGMEGQTAEEFYEPGYEEEGEYPELEEGDTYEEWPSEKPYRLEEEDQYEEY
jgi:predicted nucleic acid-binding Zn ribbon protein